MAEKKLSVRLSAKDRLSKALQTAGGAARKTGSALSKMAVEGSRAVEGLTRKLFFLKEAINVVAQVARGLWDAFITPAINARKLAVSLTNVFGAGTSQKIRKFSTDTGLSFETVSKAALDMEQKLGKAGGLEAYLKAVERVSKWRPDLGAEGAVAFVNDLVNKVTEATEGSSKQLGQYTSVMIGGTAAQAVDLSAELDKLGVVAKISDPATSALDRLRAAWAKFAAEVGGRVLEKLAEGGLKLLDWLTKNEDKVMRLADAFVNLVNNGIQGLINFIDSGKLNDLIDQLAAVWKAIEPIVNAVGRLIGGGVAGIGGGKEMAADPWQGGKGGKAAGIGRALGAAAGPAGYGTAAGNVGMGFGAAFGKVGGLFGEGAGAKAARFGQGFGENIARGGNIMTASAAGRQNVNVTVSVDDEGALKAFVAKEGQRRNRDIFEGAGGGNNPQPSYGWR